MWKRSISQHFYVQFLAKLAIRREPLNVISLPFSNLYFDSKFSKDGHHPFPSRITFLCQHLIEDQEKKTGNVLQFPVSECTCQLTFLMDYCILQYTADNHYISKEPTLYFPKAIVFLNACALNCKAQQKIFCISLWNDAYYTVFLVLLQ